MFTINQLVNELKTADPSLSVQFDFCNCVPTAISSWRGIYAEPALGWRSGDHGAPTVGELIASLEEIKHESYSGWKGGYFKYTGDEPLHIDNDGDYSSTEITRVEITEYGVIIHTMSNGSR